ncbi:hypothetical protein [Rhodococcus zopfii]|uniref:hypothetical protein n=1 Tax=Rhodococcus zopfii TaxID=43772 RepID=UPI0009353B23|nr:hypothetical protein [Rhodococcus zopfii]
MDRNRGTGNNGRHEYYSTSDIGEGSSAVRHGDFEQADWDMRFLSAVTRYLSARPWDTGVYEIEQLSWADSIMTLVVRVWGRDDSGLVGWREHLPTVRAGFGSADPEMVAGAWHTGEFCPCYLPQPYLPGPDGIHWIGTGRPSHRGSR